MSTAQPRTLTGDGRTSNLPGREVVRQGPAQASSCSPPALEATLAAISAEVMADAEARLGRLPKLAG